MARGRSPHNYAHPRGISACRTKADAEGADELQFNARNTWLSTKTTKRHPTNSWKKINNLKEFSRLTDTKTDVLGIIMTVWFSTICMKQFRLTSNI